MILSRGRKYIFLHAPKTGGTSLTVALEARAKADDIIVSDTPKGRARAKRQAKLPAKGRLWKHSTLADLEGLISQDELSQMFIVMMVRNPWERVRSYYAWLQDQSFEHPAVTLAKTLSFDAFICHPMIAQSFRSNPYGNYVTDWTGREWPTHFIRLEHLDTDLTRFEQHLGVALPLGQHNESGGAYKINAQFTLFSACFWGLTCSKDISRFQYTFPK
ncbi:MAG: sulfotransferase family 2 domain-containing protein [Pseudomonadota bacterium]